MQITTGKQMTPIKAVVYGTEGIGKTTFAAQWPKPLFIDCEGGSGQLDVARTPKPTSWSMLKGIITELTKDTQGFETLVIDTADWAERLCISNVCAEKQIDAIGGLEDYGKSYNLLATEWARLLDLLNCLIETRKINVLFLAHAKMRKFEQPEETGAYDRYELKMEKKTAALIKEWSDLMIFVNYKTIVVEIEKKKKAQGGHRVMYTSHHNCWDAKNRFSLPDELPFEFDKIAKIFPPKANAPAIAESKPTQVPAPVQEAMKAAEVKVELKVEPTPEVKAESQTATGKPEGVPEKLWNLMTMHGVTLDEILGACRKTYPTGTPITNFDPKYIDGVIIAKWDQVHAFIIKTRKAE